MFEKSIENNAKIVMSLFIEESHSEVSQRSQEGLF